MLVSSRSLFGVGRMDSDSLNVYFSNQVDLLVHPLKQRFLHSLPLTRHLVIVPSPAMKTWLTFKIAQENQIAMGFETTYLDNGIAYLYSLIYPQAFHEVRFPNAAELTLAIEWEIRLILNNFYTLSIQAQKIWEPLLKYLKILTHPSLSKKGERRLCALAETLARLFLDYGISGGTALNSWSKDETCWQSHLWNQTLETGNKYGWTYPYRTLANLPPSLTSVDHIQVHLFAMSYLPHLYHTFLQGISKNISISFYLLSPCEAFWSDICSDKESQKLQLYWEKKNAPEEQQIALEEFLRDRNPLLANFGRIGREMAQEIENAYPHARSCYAVPASSVHYPCYEEQLHSEFLLNGSSSQQLSLLEAIQTDITLLRNPELCSPLELDENDRSIQIHGAPSLLREVQILHDRILQIFSEKDIQPKDWVVMAPDIRLYAPFIKMVFGNKRSPLKYLIMDADLPEQNSHIQTFLNLINLSFSRWDSVTLLSLFNEPSFRKKQGFSYEDLDQMRFWIKEAGIRWGIDGKHRQKILQSQHCYTTDYAEEKGTWENGFKRILDNFVFDEERGIQIDTNAAPLLGKLIYLIRSLHEHLAPLQDESVKSAIDWIKYLKFLSKNYLESTQEESDSFENHLNTLQKMPQCLAENQFPFRSIQALLYKNLKKETVSYRESHVQVIKFSSMLPMRAIPARSIALLGMQEGAFPRFLPESSLHLFAFNPLADYSPTQGDFDRYLFLETLISAKDHFLISYQGFSADGKAQAPSLLVHELLGYIDKYYRLGNQPPSTVCHYIHPFNSYDRQYFLKDAPYPRFSDIDFRQAQAAYETPKLSHNFISNFSSQEPSILKETIDIKDLINLAQDPVKHYFNRYLEVYLKDEEKSRIPSDDTFSFDAQFKGLLKKVSLKEPLPKILSWADRKGELPLGYFRSFMTDQLTNEIDQMKSLLVQCGISTEQIFQIELSESTRHPIQIHPQCWIVPPIEITYKDKNLVLIGTLHDIVPQGLLAYIEDDKNSIVKPWPAYLLLNCVAQKHPNLFGTQLIFGKSGTIKPPFFENPFELLEQYLDYFFLCHERLSLLLPQWISKIIESPDDCHKHIQKTLSGPYAIKNDYVHWLMKKGNEADFSTMIHTWKDPAAHFFSHIYTHWYPAKKKKEQDV